MQGQANNMLAVVSFVMNTYETVSFFSSKSAFFKKSKYSFDDKRLLQWSKLCLLHNVTKLTGVEICYIILIILTAAKVVQLQHIESKITQKDSSNVLKL